jgi:hypothetical protein
MKQILAQDLLGIFMPLVSQPDRYRRTYQAFFISQQGE